VVAGVVRLFDEEHEMARLIKHPWLWAVVGAVLFAAWQLPPDAPRVQTLSRNAWNAQRTPMDMGAEAMSRQIAGLNDELRLIRLTDSLRVVMAQSGPATLDLPQDRARPEQWDANWDANQAFASRIREGIRRNFNRELAGLPGKQKMKVGVFAVPLIQGGYPGAGVSRDRGSGNLFLFKGDEPACVVTRATASRSWGMVFELAGGPGGWYNQDETVPTNVLGPCRFYAAYGLPGSRISEWLASGGAGFTMTPAGIEEVQLFERRRFLGLRSSFLALPSAAEACLAGRKESCTAVVMPRQTSSGLTKGALITRDRYPERIHSFDRDPRLSRRYTRDAATLVADIEADFGTERFQAFWSSEQPMDAAFAAAFGLPLGDWVHDWLSARYQPDKLGPGLSWETLLYSLALISFCVSILFAAARRRQVG
jgi:hypothetical protein